LNDIRNLAAEKTYQMAKNVLKNCGVVLTHSHAGSFATVQMESFLFPGSYVPPDRSMSLGPSYALTVQI